jgi:hypothetical protein
MRRRSPVVSTRPTKAPAFMKLLRKKDFDEIYNVLSDTSVSKSRWFEDEYSMLGENCLHTIMKYRPPARVVVLLLKKLVIYGIPEPELSVDILGRTPLHHAVGFLCEPAVIQVLLNSTSGRLSLRAKDAEGRLPLHMAILPYEMMNPKASRPTIRRSKKSSKVNADQIRTIMKATVEILVTVCPQATLVTDDQNRTPLEYARVLEVDPFYKPCIESLNEELRMAEEMTLSEVGAYDRRGMVLEFDNSSSDEDDDVSVLSFSERTMFKS